MSVEDELIKIQDQLDSLAGSSWEYKIFELPKITSSNRIQTTAQLDIFGEAGWELVSMENDTVLTDDFKSQEIHRCVFKRRLF